MDRDKQRILKLFQKLPGVDKSIANDLWNLGIRNPDELKGRKPEELYEQLNQMTGMKTDRHMLYTFRCVIYSLTTKNPDPKKLNWLEWSDDNLKQKT